MHITFNYNKLDSEVTITQNYYFPAPELQLLIIQSSK